MKTYPKGAGVMKYLTMGLFLALAYIFVAAFVFAVPFDMIR